jgi:flagellar basal-body rod protein FlgC
MDQAGNIAASGLQAASLRLQAAASNIVDNHNNGYRPLLVSQTPLPNGGVRSLLAYDPQQPFANLQPDADLPSQLVDLKLASQDFRASLLAYKASAEMFKTLLDATA